MFCFPFAAILFWLFSKCHVIKISKIFGDFVPRDSSVCQGLLPSIRHFENRRGEGPGDEVGLYVSDNLLLEYGRHVARLHRRRRRRRRRRAYAPTSNTASHGTHEKIISWVPFRSLIWVWGSAWRPSAAGAPLLVLAKVVSLFSKFGGLSW